MANTTRSRCVKYMGSNDMFCLKVSINICVVEEHSAGERILGAIFYYKHGRTVLGSIAMIHMPY